MKSAQWHNISVSRTKYLVSSNVFWSAGKELNLLNTDLQSVASTGLPPAELNNQYYINYEANILVYLATGVWV